MGCSKNKKTSKRSNDNAHEKRNKESRQEEELVEHNEVDVDDTSRSKISHREQHEQYMDSNRNDHEP